jgi:arsenic resistance protein ArsH
MRTDDVLSDLPNIREDVLHTPDRTKLSVPLSTHRPRILLLYGSLRSRSYSHLLTHEAVRLLEHFGAETRVFDPTGLPLPDGAPADHTKVQELRQLSEWSEGQVWTIPERHGAMSGVMKAQIDWIPLSVGRSGQPRGERWLSCRCAVARSRSIGEPAAHPRTLDVTRDSISMKRYPFPS